MNKKLQIKNSMIYLFSMALKASIPFVTLPILTQVLTKEDYGVYGLAQIYATFMTALANFGLPVIFERNYFSYEEQKDRYELLYSCLFFVIFNFLIMLVVTVVASPYIVKFLIGNNKYNLLLLVTFCGVMIGSFKMYFLIHFKNSENAKSFVYYEFFEILTIAILSITFVLFFSTGIIGLAYAQVICASIVFLVLLYRFSIESTIRGNFQKLKDLLLISYPLTPRLFIGVINSHFDKYMIRLLKTTGGVGIYSIAQRFANVIYTFMTALQNVFSPQVYKMMFSNDSESKDKIGKYLMPFIYLSIFVAFMIAFFCEEAVSLLLHKSFSGIAEVIIILSMYFSLMFFGKIPQLLYAKKTNIISILTFLNVLFNVSLNIPFIYMWGVLGAAWATFLSGLLIRIIHYAISQYYYPIKWQLKEIFIIYLLYFGSCTFLILGRRFYVAYEVRLLCKILILLLYFGVGFKFRIITKDKMKFIKELILKKFRSLILFNR